MPSLVFDLDDGQKVVVPLTVKVGIGSAEGNEVVVEDEGIAGFHAEVFTTSRDEYWVRDLESPAGTFVNEEKVQCRPLTAGDRVTFGSLHGQFVLDEGDAPPPQEHESATRVAESEARIQALTDLQEHLQASINEKTKILDDLHKNVDSHNEEQEAQLAGSLVQLAHSVEELAARKHQLEQALQGLGTLETARQADVAAIETRQEAAAARLAETEGKLAKLEASVADLEKTSVSTQAELASREAKRKEIDAIVETLEARRTGLDSALKDLAAQDQAKQGQIQDLSRRHDGAKAELGQTEEKLAKMRVSFAEMETRHHAAAGELAKTEGRLGSLKGQATDLEKACEKARAELSGQEARHAELGTAMSALQSSRSGLETHNHQLENQRPELEKEIVRLQGAHQEAKGRHDALSQSVTEMEGRRDASTKEIDDAEKYLTKLRASFVDVEKKRAIAQLDLENREAYLTQIEGLIAGLDASHTRFEAANRQLEAQRPHVELRLKQLQDDHAQAKTKHEELTRNIASEEGELAAVVAELEKSRQESARLEQQCKEMEERLSHRNEVEARAAQAGARVTELEHLRDTLVQDYSAARAEFTRMEASSQELQETIEQLTTKQDVLQKSLKALEQQELEEKQRYQDLIHWHANEEDEAESLRQHYLQIIEHQQVETSDLETRLAGLRSWNEEIEQAYLQMANVVPNSPEGQVLWQETQQRRKEIAEQLPPPPSIQARPTGKPKVVPRRL